MSERHTPQQRRGQHASAYLIAPPQLLRVVALPLAGLFAVHVQAGACIRVFYCEPASGRCSCGIPTGSCSHLAATRDRVVAPLSPEANARAH